MGLLSKVSSLRHYQRPNWLENLTKAQVKEILELRKAYHGGSLKDAAGLTPPLTRLYELVVKEFGKVCCRTTFMGWMGSHEPSKES